MTVIIMLFDSMQALKPVKVYFKHHCWKLSCNMTLWNGINITLVHIKGNIACVVQKMFITLKWMIYKYRMKSSCVTFFSKIKVFNKRSSCSVVHE